MTSVHKFRRPVVLSKFTVQVNGEPWIGDKAHLGLFRLPSTSIPDVRDIFVKLQIWVRGLPSLPNEKWR